MLGFWHFPEIELKKGEKPEAAAARLAGKGALAQGKLTSVNHTVTRYRIKIDAYCFEGKEAFGDWRWIELKALAAKPLASAEKKLLRALEKAQG